MPRGEYLQEMEAVIYDDIGELIDDVEPLPGDGDPSPPAEYGYTDYRD